MIGPPGTGKTTLMGHAADCFGGVAFDKTFNATTVPDEVFGPLDVAALSGQNGPSEYKRLVDGFAPMAQFLVLDEAGKAGSETLNGFLPMLDHRREFANGNTKIACPLLLAIATSNEPLPDDCRALKDRLSIRLRCDYMSVSQQETLFAWKPITMAIPTVSPSDIEAARVGSKALTFGTGCADTWAKIGNGLDTAGIPTSPRRLVQAKTVWQAKAFLDGSSEVLPHHATVLGNVLWTDLEHADTVIRICNLASAENAEQSLVLLDSAEAAADDVAEQMAEIRSGISNDHSAVLSAQQSVMLCAQDLRSLAGDNPVGILGDHLTRVGEIWKELEDVLRAAKAALVRGLG